MQQRVDHQLSAVTWRWQVLLVVTVAMELAVVALLLALLLRA